MLVDTVAGIGQHKIWIGRFRSRYTPVNETEECHAPSSECGCTLTLCLHKRDDVACCFWSSARPRPVCGAIRARLRVGIRGSAPTRCCNDRATGPLPLPPLRRPRRARSRSAGRDRLRPPRTVQMPAPQRRSYRFHATVRGPFKRHHRRVSSPLGLCWPNPANTMTTHHTLLRAVVPTPIIRPR